MSNKVRSFWFLVIIDSYIVINSFIIAYLFWSDFSFVFGPANFELELPVVFVFSVFSFIVFRKQVAKGIKTDWKEFGLLCVRCLLLAALLFSFQELNNRIRLVEEFNLPISFIGIHFFLNVIFLMLYRLVLKDIFGFFGHIDSGQKNVLIYGAGKSGLLTYTVLQNEKKTTQNIIGFIDDDFLKSKNKLKGLPVFHSKRIDQSFIEKYKVEEIIFSIENIKSAQLLQLVGELAALPIHIKMIPPSESWIENELNVKLIKEIHIEDLLGRTPIALDNPILKKEFNNKTVLVTGASGSIGSELTRQIANFNIKELILVDQAESDLYNLQQQLLLQNIKGVKAIVADVRNEVRMRQLFSSINPDIVFHAAAYKHVPFMEDFPSEALQLNVLGTKIIADLSIEAGVSKFILISTDKAVNPTNVMGASKRLAELYVSSLATRSKTKLMITRFGNVLGSSGSVIPLFESQIKAGGPLTVTHKEVSRYFMTIPEACQLVLEAGAMGKGNEIFVFDMGESVKIVDLAKNMIRLSGLQYPQDIDIVFTGLRPGEKIEEELLAHGEKTITTYHEKILIAKVEAMDFGKLESTINDLCVQMHVLNANEIVERMKEIIPEFVSNNSEFEKLDK